MYGWRTKTWRLSEKEQMTAWCEKHSNVYQIREVFINNAWAIEYRPLLHF